MPKTFAEDILTCHTGISTGVMMTLMTAEAKVLFMLTGRTLLTAVLELNRAMIFVMWFI